MFYINCLATWQNFPDVTYIKVNNGRKSAIVNLIKLNFLREYPSLKRHILFYNNGLAIWHGFPYITQIKQIIADSRPFYRRSLVFVRCAPIFELIRAIVGIDV